MDLVLEELLLRLQLSCSILRIGIRGVLLSGTILLSRAFLKKQIFYGAFSQSSCSAEICIASIIVFEMGYLFAGISVFLGVNL